MIVHDRLGENFLYSFKGGPPGRRAANSAMPASRLAASLPARAGSGRATSAGHAEARRPQWFSRHRAARRYWRMINEPEVADPNRDGDYNLGALLV